MSCEPRISYSAHPDVTPEAELSTLTSIYALAIRKAEEEGKAGATNAGENAEKEIKNVSRRKNILHRAG